MIFIINNLLALTGALVIARLTMNGRGPSRNVSAFVCSYLLLAYVSVLSCGILGTLRPQSVLIVLSVIVLPLVVIKRKILVKDFCAFNLANAIRNDHQRISIRHYFVLAILVTICLYWVKKTVVMATIYSWDDLTYHATAPAKWLMDGRIHLSSFNYQAYYPLNPEIMALWFIVPFHTDVYSSLGTLFWALVILIGCLGLVRQMQNSVLSGAMICSLFLFSSSAQYSLRTCSGTDLAGAASIIMAIFWSSPKIADGSRYKIYDVIYCGLMSGFAIGTKVTYIPLVLILFIWITVQIKSDFRWRRTVGWLQLFLLCSIVTSSFWYLRNLWLTGNPIFPGQIARFNGPLSGAALDRTKIITWLLSYPGDWEQWYIIVKLVFDWPVCFGILAASGYVWVGIRLIRRDGEIRTHDIRILIMVVGLTSLLLHPFMPFSGTWDHPSVEFLPHRLNRYLILTFVLGLVLFSDLLCRRKKTTYLCWAIALAVLLYSWRFHHKDLILVAFLTPAFYLFHRCIRRLFFKPRIVSTVLVSGVLLGLVGIVSGEKSKIKRTDSEFNFTWSKYRGIEYAVPGSRIAMFSSLPNNYQPSYPLFGRQRQLYPVALKIDGTLKMDLHESWSPGRTLWDDWNDRNKSTASEIFIRNVSNAGVDYIFITGSQAGKFPVQQRILMDSGRATIVYQDKSSFLWAINE